MTPGRAQVVYAVGDSAEADVTRGYRRVTGRIVADLLTFDLSGGASVVYHIKGDSLRGVYTSARRLSLPKTHPSRFSCVFRMDQGIWPVMVRWLGILLRTFRSAVRTHRELALENLALRQQLAVWKARQPRPQLTEMDRIFWVVMSRLWKRWRSGSVPFAVENRRGDFRFHLHRASESPVSQYKMCLDREFESIRPKVRGQRRGHVTHEPIQCDWGHLR